MVIQGIIHGCCGKVASGWASAVASVHGIECDVDHCNFASRRHRIRDVSRETVGMRDVANASRPPRDPCPQVGGPRRGWFMGSRGTLITEAWKPPGPGYQGSLF